MIRSVASMATGGLAAVVRHSPQAILALSDLEVLA